MTKFFRTTVITTALFIASAGTSFADPVDCGQIASELSATQSNVAALQVDIGILQYELDDLVDYIENGQMYSYINSHCSSRPPGFDVECAIEMEEEYYRQKADLEEDIDDLEMIISTYQGTIANLQALQEEYC